MNILIVSQYFWPENFRVNEISKYLSKKGYTVDVYTTYPNYPFKDVYKNTHFDDQKFDKKINIIRIPSVSRGSGGSVNLFLNYFTFILSGIFFSHFKLWGKKYDYILTFATSPVTVSLISIYIGFLKRSRLVMWLLDFWPDIIFELKYVKSKIGKFVLNKIVKFIYKKQDCILVQSKTYFNKLVKLNINKSNEDLIYFPSWPENIKKNKNKKIEDIFKKNSKEIKLVFTGNVGEAQGFEKVLDLCKKIKKIKFKIFVVGTGRWLINIKDQIRKKKINNIKFFGHKSVSKIYPFLKNADVLLVTLKEGKVLMQLFQVNFQHI